MDAATILAGLAYTAEALAAILGILEVSDPTSRVRQWLRRRRGQIVRLGRAEERNVAGSVTILEAEDTVHAHGSTMPHLTQSAAGSTDPPPLEQTVEALRKELAGLRRSLAEMPAERAAEMGELEARMQTHLGELEKRTAQDVRAAQIPTWRMQAIAVLIIVGIALRIASDIAG